MASEYFCAEQYINTADRNATGAGDHAKLAIYQTALAGVDAHLFHLSVPEIEYAREHLSRIVQKLHHIISGTPDPDWALR